MTTNNEMNVALSIAQALASGQAILELPAALAAYEQSAAGGKEDSRFEVAELVTIILRGAGLPERTADAAMDVLLPTGTE